jgi:hypothetical protein
MLLLAASAAIVLPVFAEISLTGEQDGSLETGNYLVTGTVTVKRGKTLSFAPGCIVRFKRYTGIAVEGALKCAGTEGLPILFTSENHRVSSAPSADAPAPFDWNGIIAVDSQSVIDFKYVHVLYSTFGLDVKSPASGIRIVNTVFDENGQFNVRVAGEQLEAKDGVMFNHSNTRLEQEPAPPAPAPAPVVVKEQPQPPPPPPVAHEKIKGAWKMPVRIGCGAAAIAGAAGGAWFMKKAFQYQDRYHSSNNRPEANDFAKKRDDALTQSLIGAILGGAGLAGFGITFFF